MNLSSLTQSLINRAPHLLQPTPEINTPGPYSCFNGGSVEIEVGEFLYALVRLVKPERILETGTHAGVSTMYMAQALHDNNRGRIDTIEFSHHWADQAALLWAATGLGERIRCYREKSLAFYPDPLLYDIAFLDTEPDLRFDEFLKFWGSVRPGGFIMIHDLHSHLGHEGTTHHTTDADGRELAIYDWPFGDFRPKLGPFITSHLVQTINFPSPRGFTLFQKIAPNFAANKLLSGELPLVDPPTEELAP